jgi:predicted nucleotidyltransferase
VRFFLNPRLKSIYNFTNLSTKFQRTLPPVGLKFYELWDYLENVLGVKVDVLTLSALKQKTLLWESVKEDILYV